MLVAILASLLGAAVLTGSVPLLRWLKTIRHERLFIRGRPAYPGLKALPSLGDRLLTLEGGQVTMSDSLAEHTNTLAHLRHQVNYLVQELSSNGGDSFRDHIEQMTAQAAIDAARARSAASAAAVMDKKLAEHFDLEVSELETGE